MEANHGMGDATNALQSMALETSYIEYSLHTTNAVYWAQARSLIFPCLFVFFSQNFQTPQTPPIDHKHVDQSDTNSCKCLQRHWAFGGSCRTISTQYFAEPNVQLLHASTPGKSNFVFKQNALML